MINFFNQLKGVGNHDGYMGNININNRYVDDDGI